MKTAPLWWNPAVHADRRPLLLARNAVERAIRSHFDADGFTEAYRRYIVAHGGT